MMYLVARSEMSKIETNKYQCFLLILFFLGRGTILVDCLPEKVGGRRER
jgi:hypothetical protein